MRPSSHLNGWRSVNSLTRFKHGMIKHKSIMIMIAPSINLLIVCFLVFFSILFSSTTLCATKSAAKNKAMLRRVRPVVKSTVKALLRSGELAFLNSSGAGVLAGQTRMSARRKCQVDDIDMM